MNLTEIYKDTTYPSEDIVKDMILRVTNCPVTKDGTLVRVTSVGPMCNGGCPIEFIKKCSKRNITVETFDERKMSIVPCFCTFHTLDDKLVVPDEKYKKRRK
jgi:hypothetical protein